MDPSCTEVQPKAEAGCLFTGKACPSLATKGFRVQGMSWRVDGFAAVTASSADLGRIALHNRVQATIWNLRSTSTYDCSKTAPEELDVGRQVARSCILPDDPDEAMLPNHRGFLTALFKWVCCESWATHRTFSTENCWGKYDR